MDIQIDPEFEELILPLAKEEREQLEANLTADGCRDPLVVWNGILLDGHNRYEICTRLNIPFNTVTVELPDREAAFDWIANNQLGRRNITPEQASYLRGKQYQRDKKQGQRTDLTSRHFDEKLTTAEKIADQQKVGTRTVERDAEFATAVDAIAANSGSDAKKAILSRDTRVSKKDVKKLAKLKPERQKKVIERIRKEKVKPSQAVEEATVEERTADLVAAAQATPAPEAITFLHDDMQTALATITERFDLVIADPPYNVTPWQWDRLGTRQQFLDESCAWLQTCVSVLKPDYNLFWFCSPQYMADIEFLMRDLRLPIQSRIVWHRRNMAKGSDAKHKFIDSWEMIFHVGNRELNFNGTWNDTRFDVQTIAVPQTNTTDQKLHPTQKPLELIRLLVAHGSYPGDHILDPFAGAGTTGHACMLEGNRRCTLIEREYDFITIAKGRIAQLCA